MRSRIVYKSIILLVILIGLCSCNKDDDFVSVQLLRVQNLSDVGIDSFMVGVVFNPDYPHFTDLEPKAVSNFFRTEQMFDQLVFSAKVSGYWFKSRWELPNHFIDPSDSKFFFLPNGAYTFTVSEFDTIDLKMTIGLSEYSHSYYNYLNE